MITVSPVRRAAVLRFAVLLAALVGFAVLQGAQCHAAMAAMPTTMTVTAEQCGFMPASSDTGNQSSASPLPDDSMLAVQASSATEGVSAAAAHESPASAKPTAGFAMACLAVFLTLLTILALVRRVRNALFPIGDHRIPVPVLVSAVPRPPTLAQLCVLRT
ncbi:hypothetical protein AB0J48_35950 [Nocardia salmonicida]|uniref:hypothetical protein n=1 Tax=Nocardia salmonicida TaxID=53431 RepID=UPI003416D8FB